MGLLVEQAAQAADAGASIHEIARLVKDLESQMKAAGWSSSCPSAWTSFSEYALRRSSVIVSSRMRARS